MKIEITPQDARDLAKNLISLAEACEVKTQNNISGSTVQNHLFSDKKVGFQFICKPSTEVENS
jgi:hypothetical protein